MAALLCLDPRDGSSHDSCYSPEHFIAVAGFFSLNDVALYGEVKGTNSGDASGHAGHAEHD